MSDFTSAIEPSARVVVAILLNSLWLATLIAAALWALFRLMPRVNATTRCAAWALGLTASAVLPFVITPARVSVQPAAISIPAASLMPAHELSQSAHTSVSTLAATAHTEQLRRAPAQPPSPPGSASRARLAFPSPLMPLPFVAWALVAAAIIARLAFGLFRLEALKRDALPLPIAARDRLERWEKAEKGSRGVRLCISDRINVPVAVGLFDSLILLPSRLVNTLSQSEIDQIVLHELAHLRRADDWTNCFQRLVEAFFFFNPAILWMARQLDLEREIACDDWVVGQTGGSKPYAVCLTRMAEITAWPHRALAAPGVFTTRRGLSMRVERLLLAGRNIGTGIALGPAGVIGAALVMLVILSQTMAPSIAFTLPAARAAVTAHQPAGAMPPRASALLEKRAAAPALGHRELALAASQHALAEHSARPAAQRSPANSALQVPGAASEPAPPQVANGVRAVPDHSKVPRPQALAATSSMNCSACDFASSDWSGRDLRFANLTGSNFRGAKLRDVDFTDANLSGSDFGGADLTGANFSGANLSGANLRGANLAQVNFAGANLAGCQLNVRGLTAEQARSILPRCIGCDFQGVNLAGQDLHGVSFVGLDLAGANLRDANLSGAHFRGVNLNHANLRGARLDGAEFSGCDFNGVDLRNVDMSHVTINGSNLSGAIMR